jgi:hypothetical protein
MLSISGTNDKKLLDSINNKVFGKDFDGLVGYVLLLDGEGIGVAKLVLNPEIASILNIGIIKSERAKGYGDFFSRGILNVLSLVSEEIIIEYVSSYFLKFGFKQQENKMHILSKDIVFPHKCGS